MPEHSVGLPFVKRTHVPEVPREHTRVPLLTAPFPSALAALSPVPAQHSHIK